MMKRIPTEELIEDIQIGAVALGRPPSASEYNKYGEYSHTAASDRFGSWQNAIEAAGLDYDGVPNGKQKIEKRRILEEVSELAEETKGVPSVECWKEECGHTARVVYNHWDSWADLLVEAGLLKEA